MLLLSAGVLKQRLAYMYRLVFSPGLSGKSACCYPRKELEYANDHEHSHSRRADRIPKSGGSISNTSASSDLDTQQWGTITNAAYGKHAS